MVFDSRATMGGDGRDVKSRPRAQRVQARHPRLVSRALPAACLLALSWRLSQEAAHCLTTPSALSSLRAPVRRRRDASCAAPPRTPRRPVVMDASEAPVKVLARPYVSLLLQKVKVFRALPAPKMEKLIGLFTYETYQDDEVIIREGDIGDSLYILFNGEARAYCGDALVASYTEPGSFFGELALFSANKKRRATVRARGETLLLRLERAPFEEALGGYRELLLQDAAFRPIDAVRQRAKEVAAKDKSFTEVFALAGERAQALSGIAVYLVVGTSYFTWSGFAELEHTTPIAGFYYAMQAGLTVGFSGLTPLRPEAAAFTAIYVLMGAVLLAGVLSTAIADAVAKAEGVVGGWRPEGQDVLAASTLPFLSGWWLLGVLFGHFYEGWNWVDSMIFAVSATSSIGFQGLSAWDDPALLFCAMYISIGVPLYAVAFGRLALVIAEALLKARAETLKDKLATTLQGCDEECFMDIFSSFDADQNGSLDQDELEEMVRFLSANSAVDIDERDVDLLLQDVQRGEDGTVRAEDFASGLQRWVEKHGRQ
mmetsp:Transcript_129169/g.414067  ORF Transcript_129169/g.414067 Transcript_129169/m.414067 type:complete len:542 (+) Transcript_129169:34-1659(+)